jgi:type III secretory pathway lipoprotein EscJ
LTAAQTMLDTYRKTISLDRRKLAAAIDALHAHRLPKASLTSLGEL